jgi:hypothetical protein
VALLQASTGLAFGLPPALIGTILGGIGVAFINWIIHRGAREADLSKTLRDQLIKENAEQRGHVRQLQKEIEDWKEDYYQLQRENMKLLHRSILLATERDVKRTKATGDGETEIIPEDEEGF